MYNYEKVDEFIEFALEISKSKSKDEAFEIITNEIEKVEDIYINDFINALNYIQDTKVLIWIEENKSKIKNISLSWGQVAASSNFDWNFAKKWISQGRPLSLIALDALDFCTSQKRENQSLWMRELNPKLKKFENLEIIAQTLNEYSKIDNTPRVKNKVKKIIENIYG